MTYIINSNPGILDISLPEYIRLKSQPSINSSSASTSLIGRKTEKCLLNTQARIEYELLKKNILAGVFAINKLLDLDDQIMMQEYKLCISLIYRRRIFVMEFRQLPTDNKLYNHSLELVFHSSGRIADASGRTKLVLVKEKNKFLWRRLNPSIGGPSGSSKIIVSIVLRWLQNEESLLTRFMPT